MSHARFGRLAALLAVLLLLMTATPSVFARGSFGGGGRSFGGGGRSFGGGGGFFGGSRPSFTPAPRPSFTPPPRPAFTPAPAPSFTPAPVPVPAARPSFSPSPAPVPSSGGFGRGGAVGNPASNRFSATTGTGGSFGKTGTAGSRSFTSTGRHDPPPPPAPVASQVYGHPYTPAYSHPYYYGGRPVNVYFGGGYSDYSFGHYGHPYYGWMPWSPVFYYNPPIYMGGGYVSGGFSFLRLLFGIVFWGVVIAVVFALIRHFRNRQPV